jgi:2,5-dihydroxypyridine 5,6-dioxygenase
MSASFSFRFHPNRRVDKGVAKGLWLQVQEGLALRDRIEGKWIDAFVHTFELCKVKPGDVVAILSETQSRQVNVHMAELALLQLKARPFHIVLPTPPQVAPVPVRSTGSSDAIQGIKPVIEALATSTMIADLTVEGTMHAKETRQLRERGARLLYISNEHPEVLERLKPIAEMKHWAHETSRIIRASKVMHVSSEAGTDLTIELEGAMIGGGNVGYADEPGQLATWPGGTCSFFPRKGAVNGTLVLARGDINLTFKKYVEEPVTLRIVDDYAEEVLGDSLDGDLMRSYFAAWGDREAYASSHVGWGLNPRARWDGLIMYDKGDVNGVEQRAYAGNFLYSTGANPTADRYTLGHFDLPVGNCTITLDQRVMVEKGRVLEL